MAKLIYFTESRESKDSVYLKRKAFIKLREMLSSAVLTTYLGLRKTVSKRSVTSIILDRLVVKRSVKRTSEAHLMVRYHEGAHTI